jgi:hypothetical protein
MKVVICPVERTNTFIDKGRFRYIVKLSVAKAAAHLVALVKSLCNYSVIIHKTKARKTLVTLACELKLTTVGPDPNVGNFASTLV